MQEIFIVFKKELRDMFRDKRVRTTTLIMPSVTVLLVVFLLGFIDSAISTPSNVKIHVVKGCPAEVEKSLRGAKLDIIEVPSLAEGEKMIKKEDARLVLDVEPNPAASGTYFANAYYNPKQDISSIALQHVAGQIQLLDIAHIDTLLSAKHIPLQALVHYQFVQKEVQVGGKSSTNAMTAQILPYLIIMWAFYGGMSIATELVAGEKEKNTLETLLISPVTRTQIALGKYLSLMLVCLTCSCSSFVAIFIAKSIRGSGAFAIGQGLTLESVCMLILVLIPTVALFASMLLAVSSFAKNPREAQTYLAGMSALVVLPAMFSQFIGFTDFGSKTWIYAIPVLNAAMNLRQILLAQFSPLGFAMTLAISLVLAAIGIKIAVTLFNRESVLARI
jgi:sodium transport system permease protein